MCNLTRAEEDRLDKIQRLQKLCPGATLTQADKEFFRYANDRTAYAESVPAAIRDSKA